MLLLYQTLYLYSLNYARKTHSIQVLSSKIAKSVGILAPLWPHLHHMWILIPFIFQSSRRRCCQCARWPSCAHRPTLPVSRELCLYCLFSLPALVILYIFCLIFFWTLEIDGLFMIRENLKGHVNGGLVIDTLCRWSHLTSHTTPLFWSSCCFLRFCIESGLWVFNFLIEIVYILDVVVNYK